MVEFDDNQARCLIVIVGIGNFISAILLKVHLRCRWCGYNMRNDHRIFFANRKPDRISYTPNHIAYILGRLAAYTRPPCFLPFFDAGLFPRHILYIPYIYANVKIFIFVYPQLYPQVKKLKKNNNVARTTSPPSTFELTFPLI